MERPRWSHVELLLLRVNRSVCTRANLRLDAPIGKAKLVYLNSSAIMDKGRACGLRYLLGYFLVEELLGIHAAVRSLLASSLVGAPC
jgi:hypothetical protein